MNTGKVKFFNVTKGFGFIKDNESGEEYFVHSTGLIDRINEDDDVEWIFISKSNDLSFNIMQIGCK